MKNTKRLTTILTATILIAIMTMSMAFTGAYTIITNPNSGTTWNNAPYSTSATSAQATAATYGNLLQYEWAEPLANGGTRNGFNPGPSPDRPDVLFVTPVTGNLIPKVILGKVVQTGVVDPYLVSLSGGVCGWDGQVFANGVIRVNNTATNTTTRSALVSLNPTTGAVNWASILGLGVTAGASIGAGMGGDSYIYKVDSKHIAILGGGVSMFSTNGTFWWRDASITPGAVYHSAVVQEAPVAMIFGPRSPGNTQMNANTSRVSWLGGWTLATPEVDMNVYNSTDVNKVQISSGRSLWNYTIDEPGSSPIMCYGDGMIIMGSYSSFAVYAINATTGVKIWESLQLAHTGYAGAYANGKLYIGCESMYVTCIDGKTGKTLWRNNDGLSHRAFYVWQVNVAYGRVYLHDLGAGRSGAQVCFDADTGEKLWASTELSYIGYYQTVVGGGKVFGTQSDGSTTTGRESDPVNFQCWDAYTGAPIWNIRMNIACPTLIYGNLYFISNGNGQLSSAQLWCISTAQKPEDWAMWRGNVDNPGYTADDGPTNLFNGPKWTLTTGGGMISSPAVVDGKLYINCNDKNVYCVDAYNGKLIWKFALDDINIDRMTKFGSSPAVAGGKVFIGPDTGFMYCLDAATGAKLWTIDMQPAGYVPGDVSLGQWCGRPSPIIYNGNIYISSFHSNKTYCVSPTGSVIWATETGGPIVSSTAIENKTAYVMTWGRAGQGWNDANNCYVLDAITGAKKSVDNMTTDEGTVINFKGNFSTATSFTRNVSSAFAFSQSASYTPVVVGNVLYTTVQVACFSAYNVTDGSLMWFAEQPNIIGENSCGSGTYVADNYGGKIFIQAGPTMACINASLVPTNNVTRMVQYNVTNPSQQQTGRYTVVNGTYQASTGAKTATNLWTAWGGWMLWSSSVVSGIGFNSSQVVYGGSESWSMTVWNASNGYPISWFTTEGPVSGSVAIWDGKMYFGGADNKIYCFEDHVDQPMAVTVSLDKTNVNIDNGDSVIAKVSLTSVNTYSEYMDGSTRTFNPPMAGGKVIVTFTSPNQVDQNIQATTDSKGQAIVSFAPKQPGTWKVIAWFNGQDKPTTSYAYAFSDQINIEATQTPATATPTPATETPTPTPATATPTPATETPTPTPATATPTPATATPTPATASPTATPAPTDNTTTYVIVIVAVVVIVAIAAAYMLMKRKK